MTQGGRYPTGRKCWGRVAQRAGGDVHEGTVAIWDASRRGKRCADILPTAGCTSRVPAYTLALLMSEHGELFDDWVLFGGPLRCVQDQAREPGAEGRGGSMWLWKRWAGVCGAT